MKKTLLSLLGVLIVMHSSTRAETTLNSDLARSAIQHNTSDWVQLTPVHHASPPLIMRDPFSDPQIMSTNGTSKSNFSGSGGMSSFGMGFQRSRGNIKIPQLIFKGFIDRGEENSPMALIQVSGSRVHMVREGDEINIDPSRPRQAIRITKISRLSITVEADTLGIMKVLR
ncbi:MAG: hypothetical protein PSN44_02140 [Gammaproteobacteria bacterium]|nr:hypothetical protein [Gammaproteobacteria bacterium]